MKIRIFVFLLTLSVFKFAGAQREVTIDIGEKEMSKGTHTAFTVLVPESTPKIIEKEWEDFVEKHAVYEYEPGAFETKKNFFSGITGWFEKDRRPVKVERKGKELIAVNLPFNPDKTAYLDAYAMYHIEDSSLFVHVFYQYSDSIFVDDSNTDSNGIEMLKSYTRAFGVETYRKIVREQIDEVTEDLRRQNAVARNYENKNKSLSTSIYRYESDIEESKNKIPIIESSLESLEKSVTENKRELRGYKKRSAGYDTQKARVKQLEKEYKREYKNLKGERNKIKRNENRIQSAKSQIAATEVKAEIELEKVKVIESELQKLEQKLANIK